METIGKWRPRCASPFGTFGASSGASRRAGRPRSATAAAASPRHAACGRPCGLRSAGWWRRSTSGSTTRTSPKNSARCTACRCRGSRCGGCAAAWVAPPSAPAARRALGAAALPEAARGALMQIDGSPFAWLEARGPELMLLGAVDDATTEILALHFSPGRRRPRLCHAVSAADQRYGGKSSWQIARL